MAQGVLHFANRNLPHPAGAGQTYNIPIWYLTSGDGAGDLPFGVRASLFLLDNVEMPLATVTLRAANNTQFFASPQVQQILIPNHPPGSTPELLFRVWQGTNVTFNQAVDLGYAYAEVRFTSRPLESDSPQRDWPAPGMNFSLDSSGVIMIPEPATFSLWGLAGCVLLLRRLKMK